MLSRFERPTSDVPVTSSVRLDCSRSRDADSAKTAFPSPRVNEDWLPRPGTPSIDSTRRIRDTLASALPTLTPIP